MTRLALVATCVASALVASSPAEAAERYSFDIPASRLDQALTELARQGRVSISLDDAGLHMVRSTSVKGRMTVSSALGRLLRGTGFDFRLLDGGVVQVFRRAPELRRPRPAPFSSAGSVPAEPEGPPIIVTASKQNVALADYAGAFHVASFDETESLHIGSSGSEALFRELPNLTSTNLGSGRNKIFIRGIADSSFNGQLQSTVSQYLGESRLTYSAPDPDLALYDVEKVEVIEGPQGTLYGAGSLGGVIRIMPRPPISGELSVSGTAALSVTDNELGGDGAVVANIPIGGRAAARLVAYRITRAGYIDDPRRGLSDVNRTKVSGMRATFRMEFNNDLSVDAGIVSQDTGSRDSQYTDDPQHSELTRRSFAAQPFDNDYRLIFGTLRAGLGFAELVSNTSYTIHPIDTVFDATPPEGRIPLIFKEATRVKLLTHETRLSGSADWISNWVSGVSFAHNVTRMDRSLGPADAPETISDFKSETLDAALFGEATVPVWRNISFTGGGRLSLFTRFDEFKTQSGKASVEPIRSDIRLLPTAALSWQPWTGGIVYLRYQQGYRPGAQLSIGGSQTGEVRRFKPDEIATREIGLRFGNERNSRFSGSLSLAYSRWDDVQADLVTTDGFPYVANLGSGFVRYVSASAGWSPVANLKIDASGFLATSHLDHPAPEFAAVEERDLPNIADHGWRIAGTHSIALGEATVAMNGSIEAVGKSYLGIGSAFERSQGDYLATSAGVRVKLGNWGISLDVDNLLDSRANTFSYGNPFSLAREDQRTPLRPRTFRIGVDAAF